MTDRTSRFQFDLPAKTKFDENVKEMSKSAKQITNDIKLLKENIQKWTDPTKHPLEKKIKLLMAKHYQNLKSLVRLTDSYPSDIPRVPNDYVPTQTQIVTTESANDTVIYVSHDVYSRAAEISTLTTNISELKEMFQEMATLLEYQHECIGLVEIALDDTKISTSNGNDALRSAINSQRKNRKICCCVILIVVILFAIGAIILGTMV